jgi:uncharacterized protein
MGGRIARACMSRRRWIFIAMLALVAATGAMIPRIDVDTDPENMLPADQPARLLHNTIKQRFDLYEMIVVGIVNETHPNGVYNVDSLMALHGLTRAIEGIDGVVARDLMSLATVDNVEQVEPGTISFHRMLATPPATAEAALALRSAVERLPMFHGTLVSEDGRAAGIYVPIADKKDSHRIAQEIGAAARELGIRDDVHIAGQPVAQDTFGVEMFQQMAISAPLAGLIIFLVMLYFFRSVPLVLAPMLLAMTTVVATMGLLIGLGYTVHIMSSMIPIFLMPIAVVASVHVLSSFSDRYRPGQDPQAVMAAVMQTLYKPIIFTALTTAVGFASLTLTPIPPVQVFGAFVAFGVLLAMVMTLTFVPAYTAALPVAVVERMARRVTALGAEGSNVDCALCAAMSSVGRFAARRSRTLLVGFAAILAASTLGILQIQINDNPTRWFKPSHEIRIADAVLNHHFAGTYEAYLVLEQTAGADLVARLTDEAEPVLHAAAANGVDLYADWRAVLDATRGLEVGSALDDLMLALDDELFGASAAELPYWEQLLSLTERLRSEALYFQRPDVLGYMAELQEFLAGTGYVGKSNSIADLVRTINRELVSGEARDYRIPDSAAGVAQAILSFQSSHRPHDLWHFVAPDYRSASIWLQLTSGDNQDMQRVLDAVDEFVAANPPPPGVSVDWAGMTFINLVWQGEMVAGMLHALLSAFVIVLIMMVFLFRSVLFGVLAMLPLSFTIALIYGVMGLIGKDYDMPVAVLSSLSLGLSVDFAIHFIQRLRAALADLNDWRAAIQHVFGEPARAITRNAVVIAIGFMPLLAAPLVPYMTVGAFLASIMAVSAIVTLLMLPAVLGSLPGLFFGPSADTTAIPHDITQEYAR